jgi:flagellar basal body L-ring protein FlgH
MTKSTKMLIAAAAMTGLLAGATAVKAANTMKATLSSSTKATKVVKANYGQKAVTLDDDKHDCKGKNDCKGKGGCKTDSHECKGKNDCKGKGGCKSTDKL